MIVLIVLGRNAIAGQKIMERYRALKLTFEKDRFVRLEKQSQRR